MLRLPLNVPAEAGANFNWTVQLAPAARVDVPEGQPLTGSENPVPVTAIEVNERVCDGNEPPLMFLTVTVLVTVVPWTMEPKFTGLGLTVTSEPVPVRLIFCGVSVAASAKLMLPLRALMSFGENATVTVQLDPVVIVAPQVSVVAV